MKEYKTVLKEASIELVERKSRFICNVSPVKSEFEALDFIKKISETYKDATHNVFAYIAADEVEIQRASDDGEPQGTAGIPVLEVLKKEELTNTCVVVTRYFGGILLGAGGLIRAYSAAARSGVTAAEICRMGPYTRIMVKVNYTQLGKIQNSMASVGNNIINIEYTEFVRLNIKVKQAYVDKTVKTITELTCGEAEIILAGNFYDVYEEE